MPKAVVLLASGFEEIEAVTVIDVLRRADIEVCVAGLDGGPIRGSHDIQVGTDCSLGDVSAAGYDAVVLPGGLPGATNLRDDERVLKLLGEFANAGKLVSAICAAPIVLDAAGVLEGRRATGYPGFELPSAVYLEQAVVEDGNVVTSRGPGTALEFALSLVGRLAGAEKAAELEKHMLVAKR